VLVLASASPRRADTLRRLGLPFEQRPTHVDETVLAGVRAQEAVAGLARRKAEAAAQQVRDGWVVGADTLIEHRVKLLGKPRDAADALAMLTRLQGSKHDVLTALCVLRQPGLRRFEHVERSTVQFGPLSRATLEAYVATGEPLGKAGSYAVQGIAAAYITRIDGSVDNVVGLPIRPLLRLLREAGYALPAHLVLQD
jgi:septum formation protein